MSLVAYGSSDDSDAEESAAAPDSRKQGSGGLFSLLPCPQKTTPRDDPQQAKTSLFSSLPKPRKRTEPVRIPVPQIQKHDSDSDDDEPAKKKLQSQAAGSGLSSLLPQPKNLTLKEMDRPLIPHTLTKRSEPKGAKPGLPSQGLLGSSASPSAIKAAAKSAARQLARQIVATDDHEEDITPQNYFSLGESPERPPAVVPSYEPEPVAPVEPLPPLPAGELSQSDAPLDFGGGHEGAGAWGGQYPQYQQPMAGPESYPEGYNNEAYYQDPSPGLPEAEEPGHSAMFDDEAFMRLQGKRNRGKEEVKFLEIKGDDQLSGHQQWLTKSMSEEKNNRGSFSKKRGGQPTGQQRRKHQITYLIHQAKERELELKNSWAENRMTRRQTQAKYGF
ncbi:proline-rich protein PRCC isoform X2 [Dunckerocampus dactyliophorus]|uniref:proline-rich protein PRCC isoform X2 n=1 Tax=Dunckerocampus dactyliophorus TaxID=161453 RepID=UPI002404C1BE|nr:proline-rich protein PRCC isoform X2 [Dunckerocampus dactyliophorus]